MGTINMINPHHSHTTQCMIHLTVQTLPVIHCEFSLSRGSTLTEKQQVEETCVYHTKDLTCTGYHGSHHPFISSNTLQQGTESNHRAIPIWWKNVSPESTNQYANVLFFLSLSFVALLNMHDKCAQLNHSSSRQWNNLALPFHSRDYRFVWKAFKKFTSTSWPEKKTENVITQFITIERDAAFWWRKKEEEIPKKWLRDGQTEELGWNEK